MNNSNFSRLPFKLYFEVFTQSPLMATLAVLSAIFPHVLEVLGLVSLIPLLQSGQQEGLVPLQLGGVHLFSFTFSQWLIIMMVLFSGQMIINVLRCWIANELAQRMIAERRKKLLKLTLDKGYGFGITINKGKTIHAFLQECERLGKGLVGFINLCAGVSFMIVTICSLAFWSWEMTLLLIPFGILVLWVMKVCNRAVYKSGEICFEAQRQTSSSVMETLQNITSVFSTLCRTQREEHFQEQVSQQQKKESQRETIYQSTLHLTRYVVFIAVSLLLLAHHHFPSSASMNTEELVAFLLILSRLQPIASTLSMDISNVITGSIAHDTLVKLEINANDESSVIFGSRNVPRHAEFKVNDLSFQYEHSKHVLEHFSAHFAPKSLHVIHGPSGCGKSTLLHLMSGLLAPSSGSICLGETPIQELSEQQFFQNVTLVPQDAEFFMMSLRENLCLALEHPASDRDIMDLAKMCSCDDIISDKNMGLDTNMYSLGKNMSGGQKKKLMILRALLRRPKILLCDEPTSGLDEDSSREILELFQNLKRTMTVIVVSHDHKLIDGADVRYALTYKVI